MKTLILLLFMILFAGISQAQVAINASGASGGEGLAMGGVISSYVEGSRFLSLKRGLNF